MKEKASACSDTLPSGAVINHKKMLEPEYGHNTAL
jgi:hypothetical protein